MIKPTSRASENKAKIRLLSWLAALAERAGTRLYLRDDLTAIANGWQITQRHGGMSRRYRDPRFDTLAACSSCQGKGTLAGMPCAPCRGTGRITREHSPAAGGDCA